LLILLPLAVLGGFAVRDLDRAASSADRVALLESTDRQAYDLIQAVRASQAGTLDYLTHQNESSRRSAAASVARIRALADSLTEAPDAAAEPSRTDMWRQRAVAHGAAMDSVLRVWSVDSARLRWNDPTRVRHGDSLIAAALRIASATDVLAAAEVTALDDSLDAARQRSRYLLALTLVLGISGGVIFQRVRGHERISVEALAAGKAQAESLRAELRSILDGAEDGVFWYDPSGIVRYVNRAGAEALGRPADAVVGRPVGDALFAPAEVERWIGLIRSVASTGASHAFDYEQLMPEGVTHYYSVILTPVRDSIGSITGVVEFARDLTANRDAEQRLRRREAEFATLVEAADDVIVQIGANLVVTYLNPAAARLSGVPANELLGRPALEVPLDAGFKSIWLQAIQEAMVTSAPVVVEYDYPAADGTLSHFQARFTPEPDPVHNGTGVFVIARDITALHRAAEALASREAELRAIVDGVEDLLMRFDREGRIDFLNPAYSRAVGRSAGDFLGQTPAQVLVDPVARTQFSEALGRVLDRGQPATLEFEYRDPTEQHTRYYLTRFTPLRDGQGQVTGVLTLSHDLTERRTTELERERLLEELLHAKAAVTTLKGLLPTCSWCHKIRDEHGHWEQMESYIARRSEAEFSHGLCPDCAAKMLTE
jgi:PAS domain S-box-containing protein